MTRPNLASFVAFFLLLLNNCIQTEAGEPAYKLVESLLSSYPPSEGGRPVKNLADIVNITLTFSLLHMDAINDVDETISVLATLKHQWTDPFLSWADDPAWAHIDSISIKSSSLWTPRILHENNVADQQVVQTFGERSRVIVTKDGRCTWEPTGIFTSNCKLSLTKFPFDKQTCQILFTSRLRADIIVIEKASYGNFTSNVFGEGSIWSLTSYKHYMSGQNSYNQAYYEVTVSRNVQYFLYNIIFPCILLSILQLATFCLNPEAPDRPAFSVSVLVAFGIFQILIQEKIPKTSELILLLLYIIIQFAIGTTCTLVSAIFCYIIGFKAAKSGLSLADGDDQREAEEKNRVTLNRIRKVDAVAFFLLFAATGASHGVLFYFMMQP